MTSKILGHTFGTTYLLPPHYPQQTTVLAYWDAYTCEFRDYFTSSSILLHDWNFQKKYSRLFWCMHHVGCWIDTEEQDSSRISNLAGRLDASWRGGWRSRRRGNGRAQGASLDLTWARTSPQKHLWHYLCCSIKPDAVDRYFSVHKFRYVSQRSSIMETRSHARLGIIQKIQSLVCMNEVVCAAWDFHVLGLCMCHTYAFRTSDLAHQFYVSCVVSVICVMCKKYTPMSYICTGVHVHEIRGLPEEAEALTVSVSYHTYCCFESSSCTCIITYIHAEIYTCMAVFLCFAGFMQNVCKNIRVCVYFFLRVWYGKKRFLIAVCFMCHTYACVYDQVRTWDHTREYDTEIHAHTHAYICVCMHACMHTTYITHLCSLCLTNLPRR
jgi:hypothetical protein